MPDQATIADFRGNFDQKTEAETVTSFVAT